MKRSRFLAAPAALFALSILHAPACEKGYSKEEAAAKKAAEGEAKKGSQTAGASRPRPKQPTATLPSDPKLAAPPDVAAPPADAQKTVRGVFYKVLQPAPAAGAKPTNKDKVRVHYTGWTTDGKMFDSSYKRGQPATFGLGQVIPGWTDGLQVMTVGEKTRFWIPEEMAYKGQAGRPQGMLVFDIELLEVLAAPKAPEDVAAPPASAKKTAKGVSYVVLQPGKGGKTPRAWDKVKVHYSGWTTDGNMFDSSVTRGQPAEFPLGRVIPGWTDGLQTMTVGQKSRMWIPKELAYDGQPGKPQGMLVFDVELLAITEMPAPPPAPADVAAPPADAQKTEKGVFYKVLVPGTGDRTPKAADRVKVHYSGWTTDGKMFDSSVTRGHPVTFGLGQVVPGWTDGLQTMKVGGKTRLWIPEELAYKGKAGAPRGMLVFDVELLEIL